jgi:hypothetical protein
MIIEDIHIYKSCAWSQFILSRVHQDPEVLKPVSKVGW